ncbi:dehydrogenase/reductase SDR family member 13 [Hypomesus transpacificus]|uniref:dehydrogenase/reductase SDR family member 13 n=1 Tax=Hypomesus transpacificus TaxID=137520 RepID=UPI001F077B0C|nr:dehydrogenase/reductase SDR family member 13 [Hypomesus transpacificus]
MFTLLVIAAGIVTAYILLHLMVLKLPKCKSNVQLHGKVVIVTGANTGIGKTTALDLARRGGRVILACRDKRRAEEAILDIVKETGNREVVFMALDLGSMQSVRSFAENFLKSESRLDILINNAGLMSGGQTVDGVGMIFGVNHLGHFLLTLLLLERLKEGGPSRVVTVASKGYEFGRIDFSCIDNHKDLGLGDSDWNLFEKYCHSKLCNVLFTHELATRLQGSNVTCYSLHPGAIKTEIGRYARFGWKCVMTPITALFFVDAVSGAQTTLHCALQEGLESLSGRYFSSCSVQEVQAKAKDDEAARKLWEVSERLCGMS